jgi:hypothetical protein
MNFDLFQSFILFKNTYIIIKLYNRLLFIH